VTQPVFRFAPSPNGRLHLGHAYSALLNAELAPRFGGRFLLRIEDIDLTRCRPEYEAGIDEDLAWLGLSWEKPVRRQSEHFEDYRSAFRRLAQRDLVYPCFCSRKDIAAGSAGRDLPRDPDGTPLYPGTCAGLPAAERTRRMASGEAHAWRLHMRQALAAAPGPFDYRRFDNEGEHTVDADPARWGDAVVVRKETPTSYHLSVVVDDAIQGVTHVVRGKDLEAATTFTCCCRGFSASQVRSIGTTR
jgi:glutamyl-Q tRNA(Asp) synthetase